VLFVTSTLILIAAMYRDRARNPFGSVRDDPRSDSRTDCLAAPENASAFVLGLQQAAGNRSVARLIASGQARLQRNNHRRTREVLTGRPGERTSEVAERTGAASEREYRPAAGIPIAEEVDRGHFRLWGFTVDSDQLPRSFLALMSRIVDELYLDPSATLSIEGHASRSGSEQKNRRLSVRRAQRIEEELVALGVEPARIDEVVGRGYAEPLIEEHGDPAAMARNRRVEIWVARPSRRPRSTPPRPSPPPGPPPSRLSCRQCEWIVRYSRVLKSAWAGWLLEHEHGGFGEAPSGGRERLNERRSRRAGHPGGYHGGFGFVDPNSGIGLEQPPKTAWMVATRREGFSREEAERMYAWYPGEQLPNGPHRAIQRANRDIEMYQRMIDRHQCDPSIRYTPPYDVPMPRRPYDPREGLRPAEPGGPQP
jgi:outer membrane protein OmpA-like peptidoglycan-associated protein